MKLIKLGKQNNMQKDLKDKLSECEKLIIYHERQRTYSGLLLQALTDTIKDPELIKKIVNSHFKLMGEYDKENPQ